MGHRRYAKRGRQRYSGDLCLNTIYEAGKTTSAQPPMAHDIPPQAIDYHVAVICVLEEEAEAVRAAFDHRWDLQDEGDNIVKHHGDKNQYNTGVIFKHNVVLATPDKYGKGNATRVIAHLRSTFPGIRWCLAVGVCGGVPAPKNREPIYLGDVIVSTKIVEYDAGKQYPSIFDSNPIFQRLPDPEMAIYLKMIRGKPNIDRLISDMHKYLAERKTEKGTYPGAISDQLFPSNHLHKHYNSDCKACNTYSDAGGEPCVQSQLFTCDKLGCTIALARTLQAPRTPHMHFGYVASGDTVLKSASHRERYADALQVIAFEMEGAGVAKEMDCLVIKGVCDYADSHKNHHWQPYAASAAAACMKALLVQLRRSKSLGERPATLSGKGSGTTQYTHSERKRVLSQATRFPCVDGYSERPAGGRFPKTRENKEALVKSLEFDHIEDRYNNIRDPKHTTCEWLFTNSVYQSWLDQDRVPDHHGILWLKGKPGTGKSTLIKLAYTHARKSRKEEIHISFFFNARGSPLEKGTLGMYRSILFQLFTLVPTFQEIFDDYDVIELPRAPRYSWSLERLKDILLRAIRELGTRRLWIFVDALDECDEDQVRDMVVFFEHLGGQAAALNLNLRVFFASRHYPKITTTHKAELTLEDEVEHDRDIKHYIQTSLRTGNSKRSEAIGSIIREVKRRARGVFIWVVLVVQILNKAYDHGRVAGLERKIQEIPFDLGQLFKEILTRDDQNMGHVRLCFQWILLAKRPLSRKELYFAILSGTEPQEVSPWDPREVTLEIMDAFILSCSKGLAEVTGSTVQFIHETVRDFLLKREGMIFIQEESSQHAVGSGHDSLKRCCDNYLSAVAVPKVVRKDIGLSEKKAPRQMPFIQYALWHVFFHANAAESNGIAQTAFLRDFDIQRWIQLSQAFPSGRFPRPNHVWMPFSFTQNSSLLSVLIEQDFGALVYLILRNNHEIDIRGNSRFSPIITALEKWSFDALTGLLTCGHSNNEVAGCSALSTSPPTWDELVGLNTTYRSCYKLGGSPPSALQFFFQWGTESDVWVLLRSGRFDLNIFISTAIPCSPLSFIVGRGFERCAEYLLGKQDVDLEIVDECGLTALSKAARDGQVKMASLLLQSARTVNVNSRSHVGRTPLSYAAEEGREGVFKLLLHHPDVDVNLRDNKDRTALFHAAARGHKAIIALFVAKPLVDLISRDNINHTALSYAVLHGHEKVVEQLLASGEVDVNSKDTLHGRTALSFAFEFGYHSIARRLLDIPVIDVSIRDNRGLNLLDYALRSGREDMAGLIRENSPALVPFVAEEEISSDIDME